MPILLQSSVNAGFPSSSPFEPSSGLISSSSRTATHYHFHTGPIEPSCSAYQQMESPSSMRPFVGAKLSKSWSSTAPRPSLDTLSFSDTSVEHSSTRPHVPSSIPMPSSHHPSHSSPKNVNHLDQPTTLQPNSDWSNIFSTPLDPSVLASLSMGNLDQLPPGHYSSSSYHAHNHSRTQPLFTPGPSNTLGSWSQSPTAYAHPAALHEKPALSQSATAQPSRPYISMNKDPRGR